MHIKIYKAYVINYLYTDRLAHSPSVINLLPFEEASYPLLPITRVRSEGSDQTARVHWLISVSTECQCLLRFSRSKLLYPYITE